MEKFTTLEGVAAPIQQINVDTDMIIPKQYLKTIKRTGLGKGLFSEQRYKDDGSENPDFVLNKPAYRNAKILVAGDNFGCGSSREHAPWALHGFRHPLRDLDLVRRHFLQQLLQERHAADPRLAGRSRQAVRRCRPRRQCDADDRSREAGNPRAGRRRGEVRDRSVPQALPAQRPRRHRPHASRSRARSRATKQKAAAARPWA